MKVTRSFIGTDFRLHLAGEILPDDAFDPAIRQDLADSGLIEPEKQPEAPAKPKTKTERKR